MPGMKSSNSRSLGPGCVCLFLLPFALVGVYMAGRMASQLSSWMEARTWVECPAVIEQVQLHEESSEGTTYTVTAQYIYSYHGVEYQGTRVWLRESSDSGSFFPTAFRQLKEHQQSGQPFRCYVDPDKPIDSVLYRDLRLDLLLFQSIFVMLFGGVGFVGLFATVRLWRKLRQVRDNAEHSPNEPWKWDPSTRLGEFSPTRKWLEYAVGAILFNSIAIPGCLAMYVMENRPNWALWLCIPFALSAVWLTWKAIQGVQMKRHYGAFHIQLKPWPYFIGNPLQGVLMFPGAFPTSRELIFELQIFEERPGDESNVEVFKETRNVPNNGGSKPFEFFPPEDVPRTRRDLDDPGEKTSIWKLNVKGSDGPRDFEAQFALAVFEQ